MSELCQREEDFDGKINSSKCVLINLSNNKGTLVQISNYGARIVSFIVCNDKGEEYDIVIGHDSLSGYEKSSERYFNAVIGRYAGRIAKGKFKLKGQEYNLSINNSPNHLHGGFHGLNEQVWKICDTSANSVELSCSLPADLDGYPGEFNIHVRYTLTDDNSLMFETHASSSAESVINITNHAFFNLGKHEEDILSHKLFINASRFLPVDKELIPTGEMRGVKNSAFDFTSFKEIGVDIKGEDEQLKYCSGYDHSYVCDDYKGRNLFLAGVLMNIKSGLKLEVFTNQPSLHLYSCNFLSGKDVGKGGVRYGSHNAVCLETQHFPDSPNHKEFPTTVIKSGEEYSSLSVYKVSSI